MLLLLQHPRVAHVSSRSRQRDQPVFISGRCQEESRRADGTPRISCSPENRTFLKDLNEISGRIHTADELQLKGCGAANRLGSFCTLALLSIHSDVVGAVN